MRGEDLDLTSEDAQAVAEGDQARVILESEAFSNAVARVREGYIQMWQYHAPSMQDRESIHARVTALDEIVAQLKATMDTGAFHVAQAKRRGRR